MYDNLCAMNPANGDTMTPVRERTIGETIGSTIQAQKETIDVLSCVLNRIFGTKGEPLKEFEINSLTDAVNGTYTNADMIRCMVIELDRRV